MKMTAQSLPDDSKILKDLLFKQQTEAEQLQTQLRQKIHSLLEALRLEKHRRFGASSEKSPGQSELFDEADTPSEEPLDLADNDADVLPAKPRKNGVRKPLPKSSPSRQRAV